MAAEYCVFADDCHVVSRLLYTIGVQSVMFVILGEAWAAKYGWQFGRQFRVVGTIPWFIESVLAIEVVVFEVR